MSFEKNLQNLMKKKQVTNYRLAKNLCVSATTVGYWVSGKNQPDLASAMKLAEYFGVTVEALMK